MCASCMTLNTEEALSFERQISNVCDYDAMTQHNANPVSDAPPSWWESGEKILMMCVYYRVYTIPKTRSICQSTSFVV